MPSLNFSPKEFLKKRRPERFSDSVSQDTPVLDRSTLEYHLATLTSRSEESLFEEFSRRLLERTVCPNLIPHTGPTGGGDSKVDSETYPVAETLALGWYIGSGSNAATERWAFAFSAKKDWRSKVQGDVAKIFATGRGYTKVFFVSSQYIRDKERGDVEDKLRQKCGVDVRIFDRTWILNKVFDGRLETLAIDHLKISTRVRRETRKGPRDSEREQDFQAVEDRINANLRDGHRTSGLVEDCLEAADLARSLERPRTDVEGLYARADRMALEFGTRHQQICCAYERAWTIFWWYEDYRLFADLYAELERRAADSRNAYDLELWTNAFFCLHSAISHGLLTAEKVGLAGRVASLFAALDQLAAEQERPSASLQARTLKLHIQLSLARNDERHGLLRQIAIVVREVEGLVGYPFEPLVEIVTEWGKVFNDSPAFKELFETVLDIASRRTGELSAARMLLSRGAQQLDLREFYEAIRTLGRAMGRLYKNESREELVQALYLCSHAYERVGLLWAARGTMLSACAVATSEFWTHEKTTPRQAVCYNRMKWIELRLGRVGHVLAWHELDRTVQALLTERGYRMQRLNKNDENFDPILGMLMLRADLWDLRALSSLPDVLDGLGLPLAAIALTYALGHEDKIPRELAGKELNAEEKREFFKSWRDQPAASDIAPGPVLYTGRTVMLESQVAGCKISVSCRNAIPCVELGESLLACIEALLATVIVERVISREPDLVIKVSPSDFAEEPFAFEATDIDGKPCVEIGCRTFEPHKLSIVDQGKLKDRLFELVAHILARVFQMRDPTSLLTRLFRDDLAPQRALDFTTSFVVVGIVLGDKPKTDIDCWVSDTATKYAISREKVWDEEDRGRVLEAFSGPQLKAAPPGSEPPADFVDPSRTSHNQTRTVSLIRVPLWDEASWYGTMFATAQNPSVPPILALLFKKPAAAARIFSLWHSEIGSRDEANKLRVAIIRKIRKANPYWYRIVLGSDPVACFGQPGIKQIAMISRIHTMQPSSSDNLERFLAAYTASGNYILSFARVEGKDAQIAASNQLEKNQLIVRDAWEIGPNDLDAIAIQGDDDPIVPDGVKNPPITETLARIRRE
jgi:hypothetical protein